ERVVKWKVPLLSVRPTGQNRFLSPSSGWNATFKFAAGSPFMSTFPSTAQRIGSADGGRPFENMNAAPNRRASPSTNSSTEYGRRHMIVRAVRICLEDGATAHIN